MPNTTIVFVIRVQNTIIIGGTQMPNTIIMGANQMAITKGGTGMATTIITGDKRLVKPTTITIDEARILKTITIIGDKRKLNTELVGGTLTIIIDGTWMPKEAQLVEDIVRTIEEKTCADTLHPAIPLLSVRIPMTIKPTGKGETTMQTITKSLMIAMVRMIMVIIHHTEITNATDLAPSSSATNLVLQTVTLVKARAETK
jgi:hypothetical protein